MRDEASIKRLLDIVLLSDDISKYTKRMIQAVLLWVLDENLEAEALHKLYDNNIWEDD